MSLKTNKHLCYASSESEDEDEIVKSFKCRDDNIQVILLSRNDSAEVEKIMEHAYAEYFEKLPKDHRRDINDHFIFKLPDSELFKNNVIKYEIAFGDFEWEFDSKLKNESDVIKYFKSLEKKFDDDFHITIETLKEKKDYTGVRENGRY
jgi:hypothetical protein